MFLEYIILAITFLLIWILSDNYFPRRKLPPGPLRLPLIGNVVQFLTNRHKPAFVLFREWNERYGPVVFLKMGNKPTIVIDDFETSKKLLNNEVWTDRPMDWFVYERAFGQALGIIFVAGEGWREMRRFSMRTLRDFGYGKQSQMQLAMEEEVKQLVEVVDKAASTPGGLLKVKHLFTMPVLNILWSMVSNVRTPEDDVKLKKLIILVDKLTSATPIGGNILDVLPEVRYIFPGLSGATFIRKCIAQLQQYFRELLEERRREGGYAEDNRDFIDTFIKEIERHKKIGSNPNHYTDEQFITVITDLFEAGSETSSNTLEFAIYFAMKHPHVQKKIQEEIERVVGRSRVPSTADRPNMPYTEATLTEVQRMGNVLPVTVRSPTENCLVDGYEIAKDTMGIINIYSIHMDEKFWGDPWTFRPERFLSEDGKEIIAAKANRVIPFGAGKRVCLGEQMARTTLFTYFTALLQNFDFEDVEKKGENVEDDPETVMFQEKVHVGFTLSPNTYQTKVTRRH